MSEPQTLDEWLKTLDRWANESRIKALRNCNPLSYAVLSKLVKYQKDRWCQYKGQEIDCLADALDLADIYELLRHLDIIKRGGFATFEYDGNSLLLGYHPSVGGPYRPPWADKGDREVLLVHVPQERVVYKPRPTKVYLMRSKTTGLIKIGKSTQPKQRRKELEWQIGDELEILRVIPDEDGVLETELHHRFQHLRAVHPNSPRGREWFAPDDELLGFAADA